MHILLIHQAFASLDEAGGTRHHELARYLAGQGHRVTVIASSVSYLSGTTQNGQRPRWVERQQDGANITILRTYTYSALHRSFFHRLLSFFSFMVSSFWVGMNVPKVDLVWGTSPPIFQGITAWAVSRLKRVPFLFEVRDLWPAFAVAVGVLQQPLLIRASEWLERFLYRHADRVMVNSPGYVDHVRARGARRVELIPNGADPAMFDPQADGAVFRHRSGLDGKVVAMYAGAHGMSNDLGVILAAAQELKDCPALALVLLGDGKDKPALMAQAREQGLNNVIFLPPAPKSEMSEALAAADICIAILKPLAMYATTYPNKVFDYMAAGRPVVLAIDGVIRRVVEDAGAGIFVPPGDAHALAGGLRRLENDPQTRREMGAAGRAAIEAKYSRADLAQRLSSLLEEMERNRG